MNSRDRQPRPVSALRLLAAALVAAGTVAMPAGTALAGSPSDGSTIPEVAEDDCEYLGICENPPPPPEDTTPPSEVVNSTVTTGSGVAQSAPPAVQAAPAAAQSAEDLAFTGGDALRIALVGGVVLLLGIGAVAMSRRRTASG
jgi:hypothetical protein